MRAFFLGAAGLVLLFVAVAPAAPAGQTGPDLDSRVRAFLDGHAGQWRDMNVSEADGRILYDIIVKAKYTRALEIGTSTGHSGIWIAWALSKTGGRLITIDIDERRHREAVANFKEAGLDAFIDARLADAHELVPALPGPFDFVFCDADKDWYKNYFVAVLPKLDDRRRVHRPQRVAGPAGLGQRELRRLRPLAAVHGDDVRRRQPGWPVGQHQARWKIASFGVLTGPEPRPIFGSERRTAAKETMQGSDDGPGRGIGRPQAGHRPRPADLLPLPPHR